ncbi:triose or hexose phosphate/phosphate translocator, putative [Babesia bigemina]|uniref:Triose or hexose phosphate/phosphate translocator, putative n=1 Tax=Babesia bigemina TaxID=5866 RepID=A0A061DBF2_BABBI|nr:triose or hexose phosphate/phosphate translocator, putative [Babesia bigemina]CDR98031.1 triose or hexose phosphate/phosphate translocator, putative [Babesia bigemina]|eukprot:XP_012770217.1 triose or hexose phosphate/phosphate translocator, putative [Babesia bigemina]
MSESALTIHEVPQVVEINALVEESATKLEHNAAAVEKPNVDWWSHIKLWVAIGVWYGLNIAHIMTSKSLLNVLPLPWSLCSFEFFVGWIFAIVFWGTQFRPMPHFPSITTFAKMFVPLGALTVLLHCGTILSMALGTVSFTTVIKSAEPVATAALSILILKDYLNIYVYLSLIPIVAGVALASAKELDFNVWAFLAALLSNIFEALRTIITKGLKQDDERIGSNLTPTNVYMLFTLVAAVLCLPVALAIESPKWRQVWAESTASMTGGEKAFVVVRFVACGFLYYVYNDCAFYCLGLMNQVTHSVLNTMKRIAVIVVSIIIFKNDVEVLGYVGMGTAIVGGLLYSLAKQGVCMRQKAVTAA